jgi:transcription termination/antitermination protein NusG
MAKQWYVVHTFTGHENKVKASIERRAQSIGIGERFGRILVLSEEEVRGRRGKKQVRKHKVFPGYVLVEMELDEQTRYVVRNTSGVTGFVGPDRQPVPLKEHEIRNILRSVGEEAPRVRAAWEVGETVRITVSPFEDFHGAVQEVDVGREKLKVLISIFGRETPVELDFGDVEKLS